MKSILLALVIAGATVGAIAVVNKSSSGAADYADLAAKLHDADPNIRRAAIQELSSKSNLVAYRSLLVVAREEDPQIRGILNGALSNVRDPETMTWLKEKGLDFPERWTRFYAVRAVAAQQGPAALKELSKRLAGNYWQVQLAILDVVERSGNAAEVLADIAAVSGPGVNWKVRDRAIALLARIDSHEAARALLDRSLPASDQPPDPQAERVVEQALGSMKNPQALNVVMELAGSANSPRRMLAIQALGRARHAPAAPKLRDIFLDTAQPLPTRVAALRAAVQAAGEEAVPLAIGALDAAEAALRLEAASVLGEATLSEAAKTEIRAKAAKEQNWQVKQALDNAVGAPGSGR